MKFLTDGSSHKNSSQPVPVKHSVSVRGKEVKLMKCQYCDKTSYSAPGLKGHTTKMHSSDMNKEKLCDNGNERNKAQGNEIEDSDHIMKEADKVVNILLNNVIEIDDEKEELIDEIELVILDEACSKPAIYEKTYSDKCDVCEYAATATKKYSVVQLMLKHKEACCKKKYCSECDFKAKDSISMKKHMRDQHEISSVSTSPPLKRKRKVKTKTMPETEPMEIDEVSDLSMSFEDMEIVNDKEELVQERSNLMDAKVVEKQKKNEEKEESFRKKKKNVIVNKKKDDEKKKKAVREANKKKKQNLKDMKKKMRKQQKVSEGTAKYKVLNTKEIPANCKHLVNEDDILYVVPGDGCCGPNCGAAHLFKDEVYGPKLRRRMNIFTADHFNRGRYQFITNCSPENPFVRKMGDGEVRFENQSELIKFLKESEKAAFMWTEAEDLAVLADLYQIRIKIITTKGNHDKNVTVNWIYPDPELERFSELRNVKLDDMTLLHEEDNHFNLVVDRNSDLAKQGSLSHRFNVGPIMEDISKDCDEVPTNETKEQDINDGIDVQEKLETVKKELLKCQKGKAYIENEYLKCEKELKSKTEEVARLKSEVKDLKQMMNLMKEKAGLDQSEANMKNKEDVILKDTKINDDQYTETNPWHKVKNRSHGYKSFSKRKIPKEIEEEEFNCLECDFQTTSTYQLKKHTNLKHVRQEIRKDDSIRCKYCGKHFVEFEEFMYHRKTQHPGVVAQCTKYATGNCVFSADACWWSHTKIKETNRNKINCFICSKTFENLTELMMHRKAFHSMVVKPCELFQRNKCRYRSDSCWFVHEVKIQEENEQEMQDVNEDFNENISMKSNNPSVFQKESWNPKPPFKNPPKKQKTE